MKASGSLPPHYSRYTAVDPSRNLMFVAAAVMMGIILLFVSGWLLVRFANAVRPDALDGMRLDDLFPSTTAGFSLVLPAALIRNSGLALVAVLMIHELVHGLFYWLFSRRRPKFGVQGLFPYAAAPPGVYFPRNQFLIVGLSPLVLLTVAGLLLMAVVPTVFVPFLLFFMVFNASGAAGDVVMVIQLMRFSSGCFMEDSTSGVIVYGSERNRDAA